MYWKDCIVRRTGHWIYEWIDKDEIGLVRAQADSVDELARISGYNRSYIYKSVKGLVKVPQFIRVWLSDAEYRGIA